MIKLHKDYSPEDFSWNKIEKAWQAINGPNHFGRYFFIAHLKKIPLDGGGKWMGYLRRPGVKLLEEQEEDYIDVPFQYSGFEDVGDAHNAIFERVRGLGLRIEEIDVTKLPEKVDKNTRDLIKFLKQ